MSEHQQTQKSTESKSTVKKQATPRIQAPISHPMAIIQRARINPKSLTPADILQLQRTIGNRAVGRLLSEIRSSSTAQKAPVQRQEIPKEEETCPSCMQRQEIPEEEEPLQGKFETIQRLEPEEEEKLQMKSVVQRQEIPEKEDEKVLQGKMIDAVQRQESEDEEPHQTKRENNTGMPDNLKAGVESLSGIDMNDVRVHYNSDKPAKVGALAYTQGTDIHVAPGQEKHLPHEAWHVVQQAQGRVKPTMQLKGVAINDNEGLEREADERGQHLQSELIVPATQRQVLQKTEKISVAQRMKLFVIDKKQEEHSVHINEYHFAHLLHKARISTSASKCDHSVVITKFNSFNDLAVRAQEYIDEKAVFEFDGIQWGWKSENELFPMPDSANCLNVNGDLLDEIISLVNHGSEETVKIKSDGPAHKIYSTWKASNQEGGECEKTAEILLPFKFNINSLPTNLKFEPGKPGEAFVYPNGMDKSHHHLHLFINESHGDERLVTSVVLTSRKSDNHYKITSSGEERWDKDPSQQQKADNNINMVILETVCRSVNESPEETSRAPPPPREAAAASTGRKTKKSERQKQTEREQEEIKVKEYEERFKIKIEVLLTFLQNICEPLEYLENFQNQEELLRWHRHDISVAAE